MTLASELADVDLSSHVPRGVDTVDLDSFDVVIALDSTVAADVAEIVPRHVRLITWHVADPYGGDVDVNRRCADEIDRLLADLDLDT